MSQTTVDSLSTSATGLAGAASGWLELKLCTHPRPGQILRCREARCTLGASSSCTIRLRAPGIAAVHCLIIRGHERTVVRNLSADTRLNGQPFQDAMLVAGDRLTLGDVELEVVTLDAGPSPQQRLCEALDDVSRLAEKLEELESAEQSRRASEQLLQSQLELLDDQLADLEVQAAAASQAHRERERQLLEQLRALEAERDEVLRRCQLSQQQLADEVQHRGRLERNLRELEHRIREVETQLALLQCERDELRRELEQRESELQQQHAIQQQFDAIRDQLLEQQARYENERSAWEAERRSLVNQLAEWQSRPEPAITDNADFQRLEQKLAAEVAARSAAVLAWESERQQLLEQLEKTQAAINHYTQQAAAEAEQSTLWQQRCTELEEQLQHAHDTFERKLQSQISQDQQASTQERDVAREQLQREWQQERNEWFQEREQLRSLVQELTERCELHDRSTVGADSALGSQSAYATEAESDVNWRAPVDEPTHSEPPITIGPMVVEDDASHAYEPYLNEPYKNESFQDEYQDESYSSPETHSPNDEYSTYQDEDEPIIPVDSDTVLERLRRAGLLRREQESQEQRVAYSDLETSYSAPADRDDRNTEPVPHLSDELIGDVEPLSSSSPAEEDESSIQQYMDRLLRRVRGSDAPRPILVQPTVTTGSPPATPTSEEQPVSLDYVTAEQYLPRSSAPEAKVNLAAMRELANDSARTALTTYNRRVGSEGTRRLLTYSGVCFTAGLGALLVLVPFSFWIGICTGVLGIGASTVLAFIAFARSARLRSASENDSARG